MNPAANGGNTARAASRHRNRPFPRRLLPALLTLALATGLAACDSKETRATQTVARVNGEDITILQVNDELGRAGVTPQNYEMMGKQVLDALIDRQLLAEEAMRNRLHRTPEVMQAIERAKARIVEQAYLDGIAANAAAPSAAEVSEYFNQHPEYFAQRKLFDIQQLVLPAQSLNSELRNILDNAKSLDSAKTWLNKHNISYAQGALARSTAEFPEQMAAKLNKMQEGQLFVLNDGNNSLVNYISGIKSAPVTLPQAAEQIEQYLHRQRTRNAIDAEITRLRKTAKIEYLNPPAPAAR